jgi:hypothetical protein
MHKPYWSGQIGILTVSSDTVLPKNLTVENRLGKEVTVDFHYEESTDVEKGDPLTYTNLKGQETVLVFFK